jgi:NADH-quinone oxidoreductase subunit J/NAD(P)H-quinone oxidoreductase subunit 6
VALPQTVPYFNIPWDDLAFLGLATILLTGALLVVLGRDIIRSGLCMMLCLGSLAGLFALLGATLVAAAEVLIYIGGTSVLILFAIMLTQSKAGPAKLVFHHQAWAAAIAAVMLAVILIVVVLATQWPLAADGPVGVTAQSIARLLFSNYVLAFEVVSVLLLAAVIGGVFLAKREDAPDPGEVPAVRPVAALPSGRGPVIPANASTGLGAAAGPAEKP